MSQCRYDECDRPAETGKSRCRTCRRADRAQKPGAPGARPVKVLIIDIETSPNLGWIWGLWDQNVGLNQLEQVTDMMCFAAKWVGQPGTLFFSEHKDGRPAMVAAAHRLLDEADAVLHFNGRRFDVPHLNRCFLAEGLTPPSPYKQIDLLSVVRNRFKFPSNKLAYVSKALGLAGKAETGGFDLWKQCMNGEAKAWRTMEKYNRRDVEVLEEMLDILLPWIPNLPHAHLYGGTGTCPACNGDDVRGAGFYRTALSKFRQYRCYDCGSFFRSSKRESGVSIQAAAL
jgi:hypothetical protein